MVAHYQSLANVEHRFRVMKDFLGLRPVFHWTETRVHGHIADLRPRRSDRSRDRQPPHHNAASATRTSTPRSSRPRRALAELNRIRIHHLTAGDRHITVTTRRNGPPSSDPRRARRQHPHLGPGHHHLTPPNWVKRQPCRGNTTTTRPQLPGTTRSTRRSRVRMFWPLRLDTGPKPAFISRDTQASIDR